MRVDQADASSCCVVRAWRSDASTALEVRSAKWEMVSEVLGGKEEVGERTSFGVSRCVGRVGAEYSVQERRGRGGGR